MVESNNTFHQNFIQQLLSLYSTQSVSYHPINRNTNDLSREMVAAIFTPFLFTHVALLDEMDHHHAATRYFIKL